jgi:hypothetical protein
MMARFKHHMVEAEILQLVKQFESRVADCATTERSYRRCGEVSADFRQFLDDREAWNQILELKGLQKPGMFPRRHPGWKEVGHWDIEHVCVECYGLVIDWTARQFDPDSSFPLITSASGRVFVLGQRDRPG